MVDISNDLNFGGVAAVKNLPAPVDPGDAATKAYVDANSGGGSDPWTYVKLAATVGTTATGYTDTGLMISDLLPDAHYIFNGMLFLQAAALTTGPRPGIKWPAGATLQESAWMVAGHTNSAFVSRFWGTPTTANAAATGAPVVNKGIHGRFEGQFVTGPSPTGALIITISSEISGSAARIMANSWLRYRTI